MADRDYKNFFIEFLNSLPNNDPHLLKKILSKFEIYENLIQTHNEKYGLISKNDLEFIWLRHFQDSLMPLKLFPQIFETLSSKNSLDKIVDVGSGGGFPGVPLSILNSTSSCVLLEPNQKKFFFLEQILLRSLNLECVNVRRERSEYTVKQISLADKFSFLVSRAVSPLEEILSQTIPLLRVGGKAFFWIGDSSIKDRVRLNKIAEGVGAIFIEEKQYSLEGLGSEFWKAIVLFERK